MFVESLLTSELELLARQEDFPFVIELKKKFPNVLRSMRLAFHLICASESEMRYARLNPQEMLSVKIKARF